MRPDLPAPESPTPLLATSWHRLRYSLSDEGFLVAEEDSKPERYQPFDAKPPAGQPRRREEWNSLPHLHLARLDTGNQNDILDFVNRWGLLGLWEAPKYRHQWWGRLPFFNVTHKDMFGSSFNAIYINREYTDKRGGFHYHRHREPMNAFARAAKDFQYFLRLLEGGDDDKSAAQDILNGYIVDCRPAAWYVTRPEKQWVSHWQAPSLLHTCYLLRWMDLTSLKDYRYCLHETCRKIFIAGRPNERYCSVRCKENASRLRHYHGKR